MLLYELAISLNHRSSDLIDAGVELGLGALQAGSDLSPAEVAALRAHVQANPNPIGRGAAAPLPAVQTGPLVAAPGGLGAPAGSTPPPPPPPPSPFAPSAAAPSTWGAPDVARPVAPSHWGPPPGAGLGLLPGSDEPEVQWADELVRPEGLVDPDPPAPSAALLAPPDPATRVEPPAPADAADDAAPVFEPFSFGDPDGLGGKGPRPTIAEPPKPMGRNQYIAVGVVVALVLALFAYMVVNSGPDKARQQEIEEANARLDASTDDATATTPIGASTEGAEGAEEGAATTAACAALKPISDRDIEASEATESAESLDEVLALLEEVSAESLALYDAAIPKVPEQADNLRLLKQSNIDIAVALEGASAGDPADVRRRLDQIQDQVVSSGAGRAAFELDAYAQETCGFSTGNN